MVPEPTDARAGVERMTRFRNPNDRFEVDASRMLREQVVRMIQESGAEYITLEQGEMFVPGITNEQPEMERISWQRDGMTREEVIDLFCRGLMARLERSGGGVIWRVTPRIAFDDQRGGMVAFAEGWFMSRRQVEGYEIARQANASLIANRRADRFLYPWMRLDPRRLTPVEIWAS